ncbi:GNAT family N-acetyltransferase [bacterium]|nr:GNAT family N-acetyltransferase [bacterium]
MERAWRDGREYRFAVIERISGNFTGECIPNHINRNHKFANIAYWIRTSQTGKGLGFLYRSASLDSMLESLRFQAR